ncbi:MAG TPA: glycosyltransferase family 2 protein [Clostridium sp.]|uniref:glycosyltransferase family 2 protein n=1 Tax=Clostridium sp. TaxID=1506 RepID=UPI002F931387
MENDKISIIIPNYNKVDFLEQCVMSAIEQTYENKEVIVVDDYSTDSSTNIIRSLAEHYDVVKPILLQKNGGVSNARNIGISQALGKYVTFLDADDYYYNPAKIENEISLLKQYAERGADIVAYSKVVRVNYTNTQKKLPVTNRRKYVNGDAKVDFVSNNKASNIPRDYCIKKEIIEKCGLYCYEVDFYEDLDLLLRLSFIVPFYCTFEYGTAYRNTPDGLSKRTHQESKATVSAICQMYYKQLTASEKVQVKLKSVLVLAGKIRGKLKSVVSKQ